MSTRLQVVLGEAEMAEIRRLAQREGLTVGEWVRRTLRAARREQSPKPPQEKLAVLRHMGELRLPTGDIEQLLEETERGRWFGLP